MELYPLIAGRWACLGIANGVVGLGVAINLETNLLELFVGPLVLILGDWKGEDDG